MLTRWRVLLDEVEHNERIADAARQLVTAMDVVLGPMWRANTLGVPQNQGDEVNWAWDELVAAIGGDENEVTNWEKK